VICCVALRADLRAELKQTKITSNPPTRRT
jgi:hypothetical protein